ncbi:MAG: biotin/lipoyl-binding protein [Pseudomonadales bacterium]
MSNANGNTDNSDKQDAWQQLAASKPFLQDYVRLHRHRYRGEDWYVVKHTLAASHFRCDAFSAALMQRLDGSNTIGEAYQATAEEFQATVPPADQVIRLLSALREADMLGGLPVHPDASSAPSPSPKPAWLTALLRPLSIRIPLFDPDKLLQKMLPLVRSVFSVPVLLLFITLILWASLKAVGHWAELGVHFDSRFLDWSNALWLWLLYPLVKGLHELGHGLAAKRWGGEVHEMGLMFLVFMPVPYVDASSSSAFASKYQRLLVAAAGILVELALASVGMLAWSWLEPGVLRDIAFNVAFIAGVSTLLFNGNPLLRFDGYYVLCDAIEIPNLGTRSNQYLGYLLKRYLLRIENCVRPRTATGERRWFVTYGIAAGLYRVFITFTIALFVVGRFFIFGILLAVWLVVSQWVLPAGKQFGKLWPEIVRSGRQRRAGMVFSAFAISLYILIFVVPIPHSTNAQGIVQLGDEAPLRAQVEGFVTAVLVDEGQQVRTGDKLMELEDASLAARLVLAQARLKELRARYQSVMVRDRNAAARFVDEIRSAEAEYLDLVWQSKNLSIFAAQDGMVSIPRASDLPGRFVKKGDLLGHVVNLAQPSVRVVVEQSDVDAVRRRTQYIDVRLASAPRKVYRSELLSEVPLATRQLPSALLGTQLGGSIAVDARDESGTTAIKDIFQFDLQLPVAADGRYLGQSANLRFVHNRLPLGQRLWRHLGLLFDEKLSS